VGTAEFKAGRAANPFGDALGEGLAEGYVWALAGVAPRTAASAAADPAAMSSRKRMPPSYGEGADG
jgi:hypothetical protein